MNYAINQWPKLLTYLDDGDISIYNNVTEMDIRPFTTGRKNWIFSTWIEGATASANLYSLVMTYRGNNINPYYYFVHFSAIKGLVSLWVFQVIPDNSQLSCCEEIWICPAAVGLGHLKRPFSSRR